MRGHHLVDLTVSYPDSPSNLQESGGGGGGGGGGSENEIIDLLYSSKFS